MGRCKYVQCSKSLQSHYGHGLPHFRGSPIYHQGRGLGGLFNLVRGIFPILKPMAKSFGKRVVRAGMNIAKDVVRGTNLKKSLKKHGAEAFKSTISQLVSSKQKRNQSKNIKRLTNKSKKKSNQKDILS